MIIERALLLKRIHDCDKIEQKESISDRDKEWIGMDKIRLGKTELMVTASSFGVLPLQRVPMDEAVRILQRAYDEGINYYDTANAYTDSEEKIGNALSHVRQNIVISTKSGGKDKKTVLSHIENSLRMLKTDYIDLFQFHNPAEMPDPEDPEGAFAAALEMKQKGYIRHIGITNHRLDLAMKAVETGWFETMQFPFSYLATDGEIGLVNACKEADMGFIAMKGLAGGLLSDARACKAFMAQFDNVVPIWGIQAMWQLEQWVELEKNPPEIEGEIKEIIERDRKELVGNFCRSCGYCLPCPAKINIPTAARINMLLRRSPYKRYMTEEFYAEMHKIDDCIGCYSCASKCPYGLDTPELLKYMLKDFDEFYAEHKND